MENNTNKPQKKNDFAMRISNFTIVKCTNWFYVTAQKLANANLIQSSMLMSCASD